jgi:steroid 5-alpha reductase family enzyme
MVQPSVIKKSPSYSNSNSNSNSKRVDSKRYLSLLSWMDMAIWSQNPYLKAWSVYLAADGVGALLSLVTGSHVHLDLIGSGAFALAAIPHLTSSLAHVQWSAYAVTLWATKLALFLFLRATQVGHDQRLTDTLSTTSGVFGFWIFTLLWQVAVSLPLYLGALSTKPMVAGASAGASDGLWLHGGALVYGLGLVIETLADGQKYMFKQSNPGQFCNVGLWSLSQHPNFLGNLILWSGILIMNVPHLIDLPVPTTAAAAATSMSSLLRPLWNYKRLVLACISPLFLWSLFQAQAQGALTPALELAKAKYGNDPEYAKYLQQVPFLFPKLFRR